MVNKIKYINQIQCQYEEMVQFSLFCNIPISIGRMRVAWLAVEFVESTS